MTKQKHRKHRKRGSGQIQELPSGKYRARVLFDGHRVSAPAPFITRADAEGWLKKANREIAAGTFAPPVKIRKRSSLATVNDYLTRWISQRDLRPRTRAEYEGMHRRHIKATAFGKTPLIDVTPAMVRTWHANCCTDRPRARAATYAMLKAAMNTAVEDGLIQVNPCRVKGAGSHARVSETVLPTSEQVADLIAAMPDRFQAVVALAAWCGLRQGEAAGLHLVDLDLDDMELHVRAAAVSLPGGRKIGATKTAKSRRTIAIPTALKPLLQEHLDDHVDDDPDALLFPASRDKTKPVAASTLHRHWDAARTKVGLPDLRLHDLRHFAGTTAAQQGATLIEVMDRLGHSSANTALQYQHATSQRDREIADRADNVIILPTKASA